MKLSSLFILVVAVATHATILNCKFDSSIYHIQLINKQVAQHDSVEARKAYSSSQGGFPVEENEARFLLHLKNRAASSICDLQSYLNSLAADPGSPSNRRSFIPGYDEFNSTLKEWLLHRTMKLPKTSMAAFYDREMRKSAGWMPIVWQSVGGRGTDFNTAMYTAIGANQAISLGVKHLCGCTTLVIISRTGVYMAHYWESIAFSLEPEWLSKLLSSMA
jgi:hypothetical protein